MQPLDGIPGGTLIATHQGVPSPASTRGRIIRPGQRQQRHDSIAPHYRRRHRWVLGLLAAGCLARTVDDGRHGIDHDITL